MTRVLVVSNDKDPPDTDRGDPPNGLPETLHTWLASGPHDIDALILDLTAPEAAREAVAMVRARGLDLPVVLVASEAPGWDAPDLLALSRCVVLPSPVDPQSLRDAVNGLQSADELQHDEVDPSILVAGTPVPPLEERITEYRVTRRARRDVARDKRATPTGTPPLVPVTEIQAPPSTTDQARDGPPSSLSTQEQASSAPVPAEGTSPLPVSALALVRALLSRVSELDGVATTCDVIVKEGAERAGADAAVVLLPDNGRWRVAGGLGLRPVETRFELTDDSWLVREIALGAQGLIIEDTDIARSRLRGAPLASWRHLMAAPIPRLGAALILARKNDPPFDEAALRELVQVADEAAPLLTAGVQVRSLARLLDGFRDQE